ncbi:fusaric acid resistance family protein [Azonexus fungiphilus]|uniref:Fusaric acid resistance family protein n=1 Tax=Azonexus fungiphilus TaxID=146940 RepID=A0A495WNN1_9RHOO|nr:FUSC family protein [Azonexus fungiphilus]RKT62355.1 fusaric acid resistance family protein [Azonexus fungiphilus]
MHNRQRWQRIGHRVQAELRDLGAIAPSDRRWPMPLCAALASGLPLFIGAWFGRMDYGLTASLGGLVFLYAPDSALAHRMLQLMACSFGLSACYAFGLAAHFLPVLLVPLLGGLTVLVTMICRFYRIGPPGSLFFVMAAAIGAYAPIDLLQVPLFVGLITLGSLLGCLIAFAHAIHSLRRQAAPANPTPVPADFACILVDSVLIGLFVALALAAAQLLALERPYWVPVSCLAVIQGMSLRAVWRKQVHRILGTAVGLLLTWTLLMLPLDPWRISLLLMLLAFTIEILVVRHYGLAVIFITPLTIFLAEAAQLGQIDSGPLLQARFLDTTLGAVIGLLGGICLHSPRLRAALDKALHQLRRQPAAAPDRG